jgi:BioD-like phosphotransacetylase family protein
MLIGQKKYFVLHAPRQTGKTSCLLALMDYLNEQGTYKALYCNVEPAQAIRENVDQAMNIILGELAQMAQIYLQDDFTAQHRHHYLSQESYGPARSLLLKL